MTLRLLVRTLARRLLMSTVRPLVAPLANHLLDADARNIERWRYRQSLAETGRFVEEHLPAVPSCRSAAELLGQAAALVRDGAADGLVCEFGVYRAASLNRLADLLPGRTVWGFDSFAGLPADWRDRFPRGTYAVRRLPRVRRNARLVQGWFDDTLAPFLAEHPGPALLLHVDCDLYASTRTVLDAFAGRLTPGTVLVFDEYFNYPGWQQEEYRAFHEFVERTGARFEYVGYCRYAEQVAVRLL
ncbi:MAG: TylF/MycF/NovP-related O-methyltransferase [Gemmatimonadota bacterium]